MNHTIVSPQDWLNARQELLKKEKELTRLRDELSAERRKLPWVKVEKDYVFEGPDGKESLGDLFAGKSQLLVYHFMFDPDWEEGCKSCSFWADNYAGAITHLQARDVSLVTISRAPLEKLQAFKERMGWQFKWVSSFANDFNRDYQVTFTEEEKQSGKIFYNFRETNYFAPEGPGVSVFYKDDNGEIFHTYSCYSRGLDTLNGAYHLLDLVPKGRDEGNLPYPMDWVRLHDKYS